MNFKNNLSIILVFLAGLLVTADSQSHHAFSAEFDADKPFQVQGKVVRVEWINPHSWIHVDVLDPDGNTIPWMMEGGTPNSLLRAGLTRSLLSIGSEVIVRGYQSKDPDCEPKCRGSGRDIMFVDGRRLFMGSSGAGAPPPEAQKIEAKDGDVNDSEGEE
jgi:hypothetical protein